MAIDEAVTIQNYNDTSREGWSIGMLGTFFLIAEPTSEGLL